MASTTAADLFKLATGTDPVGGSEAWKAFHDAVRRLEEDTRSAALSEAHVAVSTYRPIDPEDMAPAYRRGYQDTRNACVNLVLGLTRRQAP